MAPIHADAPPLIRLEAVSKRFVTGRGQPDFLAVDRVSLEIRAGEHFGIIGSSGAGKSTLLRLINLLEKPDDGIVEIAGRDLTRLSRHDLREARAGIGMIFQQFNLLQNATVYDNVAFPLTIRRPRLSRADERARVEECLKIVGLAGKVDAYPAQLSGGQKQRVAIARALATRPAVMLCDEPTSALDSETTRSVLDVLADVNARLGVTLVIVTHELAVVRRLCDRVAVMAEGRIVEDLAMDVAGDRLETAIARAGTPREAVDVSERQARRIGGLPLPGKTALPDSDAASRAVLDERAAAANSHWMRHFAAIAEEELSAAVRSPGEETIPSQARRVGGLPLPRRTVSDDHAPPADVDAQPPTSRAITQGRLQGVVHV